MNAGVTCSNAMRPHRSGRRRRRGETRIRYGHPSLRLRARGSRPCTLGRPAGLIRLSRAGARPTATGPPWQCVQGSATTNSIRCQLRGGVCYFIPLPPSIIGERERGPDSSLYLDESFARTSIPSLISPPSKSESQQIKRLAKGLRFACPEGRKDNWSTGLDDHVPLYCIHYLF